MNGLTLPLPKSMAASGPAKLSRRAMASPARLKAVISLNPTMTWSLAASAAKSSCASSRVPAIAAARGHEDVNRRIGEQRMKGGDSFPRPLPQNSASASSPAGRLLRDDRALRNAPRTGPARLSRPPRRARISDIRCAVDAAGKRRASLFTDAAPLCLSVDHRKCGHVDNRRTVAVGVRIWQGRAQPSRIGPTVMPSPRILIKLKAIFAASSVGITSRFAAPRRRELGRCGHGFLPTSLRHRAFLLRLPISARAFPASQVSCAFSSPRRIGGAEGGMGEQRDLRRYAEAPHFLSREDSDLSQLLGGGVRIHVSVADKYCPLLWSSVFIAAKLLAPALSPMMSLM